MNHKRIMIAGTNSGCGKTTITCALIKALQNMQQPVASFKTGPDYVDPMFHNEILKSSCTNLDMFFNDDNTIRHLINTNTTKDKLAVIEGVMGFYDGLAGTSTIASSYDLARVSETPTILVVNGKGASVSIIAMIKGFLEYRENNIVGVIINNISKMFYQTIKPIIEQECQVEVLGYLENDPNLMLNHRHLGLLMPHEIKDIEEKMEILGFKASQSLALDRIIELANSACLLNEQYEYPSFKQDVTIGIVKDEAFCFYYKDNLAILEKFGAKLVYFSILKDNSLPDNLDGLILGGGYPELYAKQLSENEGMKKSIKQAIKNEMPIFAEGGGFVYLANALSVDDVCYEMAGVINMQARLTTKLQPFGYITNKSLNNNLMLNKEEECNAHEFHYIETDCACDALNAQKPLSKRNWMTGYSHKNIFAGFSHYHFYANINMPINFIKQCASYKEKRGNEQ